MSENHPKPWILLPCAPDACQECAVKHKPTWPHDKESLYYQMAFYREHGRWPTWRDAMAHCSPRLQELWVEELEKRGIDVGDRQGEPG